MTSPRVTSPKATPPKATPSLASPFESNETTPTRIEQQDTPASTPRKRKFVAEQHRDNVAATAKAFLKSQLLEDIEGLRECIKSLVEAIDGANDPKSSKLSITSMQASEIESMRTVSDIFGFGWDRNGGPQNWDVGQRAISVDKLIDDLITRVLKAPFWNSERCEALCRTPIDLVLFERIEAHHNEMVARRIAVHGEYDVIATSETHLISGRVDYAIGYDPYPFRVKREFESYLVVVEAKTKAKFHSGMPQAIVYMMAASQDRARLRPERIVNVIYGIVSDGYQWQFLRLENGSIITSNTYSMERESDRKKIFSFVDVIITACIEASPHTSPRRTFPLTQMQWPDAIERPIFEILDELQEPSSETDQIWSEIRRSGPNVELVPIRPKGLDDVPS
ncbi:hypothetical protein BGW36DRAFT_362500 [Talaromyces proteolyticus]|uniref:Uncharacterized protein n=1 Tax=Talaromyces proteolyticus TaxID=1131652 RepID=A0AAD4KJB7_9EURO|nr:uncharacterized protein BGW36DRAFT_362500 [Talaromyces proteolyticus]KAH8692959.1 hypothetical protein BGW36DRAFT_362500 [Talaromyces proteolyticus]